MKRTLRYIPILTLTLLFTTTVTGAQTPQDIAKIARASTVSLTMDNGNYGSGFFVTSDRIATSYHVIEGASSGVVSPVLERDVYPIIGIVAVDKENDLVVLRVSDAQGIPLPTGNSKVVEILDTIHVVGNPHQMEGTTTTGEISNLLGKYFLISAPISPGSSGGAVLNEKGEVIGITKATIPGRENQNLNIAVPSNYLTRLMSKNSSNRGPELVRPLSVVSVTARHLTWNTDSYEFTLWNERSNRIYAPHCLILFKDEGGEVICADQFEIPGRLEPGSVRRIRRDLISQRIDRLYYDPEQKPSQSDFYGTLHCYIGPKTRQLMKDYEIRILDFYLYTRSSTTPTLFKGVTGGNLTWSDDYPTSEYISYSFSLQNHYNEDVYVTCRVVFYDKEGKPIDESRGIYRPYLEISAGETLQQTEQALRSTQKLTESVEFEIVRHFFR